MYIGHPSVVHQGILPLSKTVWQAGKLPVAFWMKYILIQIFDFEVLEGDISLNSVTIYKIIGFSSSNYPRKKIYLNLTNLSIWLKSRLSVVAPPTSDTDVTQVSCMNETVCDGENQTTKVWGEGSWHWLSYFTMIFVQNSSNRNHLHNWAVAAGHNSNRIDRWLSARLQ